jgi:hypothetical protein
MNALQSRLSALRRRLRFVTLTRGLSLLLLILAGGAAAAGLLDWGANLPGLIRAVLLVAILGGAAIVVWCHLLTPLKAQADDLALALRVEEAYPSLNDALASTVQFLQQPESEAAGSPALRREAVERALRLAKGCDFNKVVNRRGLRLTALAALVVTGLAVAACVLQPAVAATALLRLANPYGDHDWPRATELAVRCRDRIAIGQPFLIKGEVRGAIPKKATIEFEGLSSSREVKEYPIRPDADGTPSFQAKLDMTRQQHAFRFRVRANDATFPRRPGAWVTVQVAQPPRLTSLGGLPSPQWELRYPAYADLGPPEKLSPGVSQVEAIGGTDYTLRAATDRPIALATITCRPADPVILPALSLAPVGLPSPLEALAAVAAGRAVGDGVPARLDADGQRFTLEFRPWLSGAYVLRLEDADGLAKEYEYQLQVVADALPVVNLERPSGSQSVLPDAELFIQISAEDDTPVGQHAVGAIRSAYLEYHRKDKEGRALGDGPGRLPLYDHRALGEALPQLLSGLAGLPVPVPPAAWRLRPKRLQLARRWSLDGLAKEGDILVIQACAIDFNDVAAHRTPGRSIEIELRVVGRKALAAILDEAQGKIQQDLLRLREWQEKALKKVIEAQQQHKATGKLRPEDADGLIEAEQLQKQIQARVGETPEEGLRGELRRLEQTVRDNKLPPSGARDRLKVMKEELERLAREHLPQIEPQITSARQELAAEPEAKEAPGKEKGGAEKGTQGAEKGTQGAEKGTQGAQKGKEGTQKGKEGPKQDRAEADLAKARAHQEEVQQSLDELLKYLDRWASTNEIKGEARAVLKEQKDLKAELEKVNKDFRPDDEQAQVAVRKVAEFQRRLADRTGRLLDKMDRVSQERAEKDPAAAEMLDKAAKIGKDAMLPREMADTEKQLREKDQQTGQPAPQINRAIDQQGESIKTLERINQAMEEQRKDEVERLVKKQKEERKNLDDLAERLEKLQKKAQEARNIADPEKRKAELKRLAEEQRKLEEEARKKSRELARLQAPRAGKDVAQAAEEMGRAAQQLDDGEDPEDAQKEARERLKNAEKKLQQAQNDAEEELARERLARIADQLKGLKDRQDAAVGESVRLHKRVLQSGWRRELLDSLGDHGRVQDGLGKEAAGLAEKLKGAPVFELLLKKAGRSMESAVKTIEERREKGKVRQGQFPLDKEELADENRSEQGTERLQKEASRRLQRLLDALKPALEEARRQPDEGEQGDGGEKGGGGQAKKGIRAGDGIPPMAQIKALRDEQQEVKDRTEAFAKAHPDAQNLTRDQRAELDSIHEDQQELFRLFRELTTPANEGEKQ